MEFIILEDRRWNNEGIKIIKTIKADDEIEASNKAFTWLLRHQCSSVSGALKDQGYFVLPLNNNYYLNK